MKFNKSISLTTIIVVFFIATPAFSAQFLFTPRVSASETYTDNLNLTENDTDDDFITSLSAGFDAQLIGRTSGLELNFDPSYAFYQDATENDTTRLRANLVTWLNTSKFTRYQFDNRFLLIILMPY